MQLYPAIDLKDGHCVRLLRGDMNAATVFGTDPAAQAEIFANAGCEWLHVVDLNGAFEGHSVNAQVVETMLRKVKMKLQLGGGIRTIEDVKRWLKTGVTRVIIGTAALKDPELVLLACRQFPGRIVVGIDAKDGMVATDGWAKVSQVKAVDLAMRYQRAGVSAIIYTDIAKDGAMGGPNIEETSRLAVACGLPVILSGGVSSLDDLRRIRAQGEGIEGVIVGRALYEGAFTPAQAQAVLSGYADA